MQHLYISYPPGDRDFAHRLVDDLQTAGYPVFVDAASPVGSLAWSAETRRAIRTCGALIMILSLAKRRRTGIRHEGILANRRNKPIYVLARSPGPLPRYLSNAAVLDFSGDYETALRQLLEVLPDAATLLAASTPSLHRRRQRAARRLRARTRRRQVVWAIGLLAIITLCLVFGLVFGVIPV